MIIEQKKPGPHFYYFVYRIILKNNNTYVNKQTTLMKDYIKFALLNSTTYDTKNNK